MKKLRFSLTLFVVMIGLTASGDILNLTDPSGIPVPPGTHVDWYRFPAPLLDISNPLTNLAIAYANIAAPGYHEIVSATPLFDLGQVASITEISSTTNYYEVAVEFSVPITGISDEFAPAFWAVHEAIGGGAVYTEIRWAASYLDGTERLISDGIIPEPAAASLMLLTGPIFFVGRQCRTSRWSEPVSGVSFTRRGRT